MSRYVALYERVSVEDTDPGDSSSIRHQKELLENYAKSHGYTNYRHFTDDGYTGRNFDRPAFQKMLSEIEEGNVVAVIVRDLSRLGRNYLETGKYTEEVFPEHNVRFLALANDVDIIDKSDATLSPFFNVINEWYSRELSRKVTTTYRIKQQMGQRSFPIPMYGYRQDPADPLIWRIDPPAAMVVRKIFRMALEGMSNLDIARVRLMEPLDRQYTNQQKQKHQQYGKKFNCERFHRLFPTFLNSTMRLSAFRSYFTMTFHHYIIRKTACGY